MYRERRSRFVGGHRSDRLVRLLAVLALVAATVVAATPSQAVPIAPGTVIDNFDDGDASDWQAFGGNLAGGGSGIADDRPKGGTHYLSTGWGGAGTTSSFYGGLFRNFDDGAQVVPPSDPWFNIWVYAESATTVDGYNLELTLREDTDGDGWTDGAEDSIGFDTALSASDFDDDWTLVSAPLSSFFDRGTGGNGVFDGALDEIVIVFGGVTGADPSAIEVDFDEIAFTSGGPAATTNATFADLEHGDPLDANGWFSFGGAVGGGGIGLISDDPAPGGGTFALQTGWGSGGTPGFYGGFGRTNPIDVSGTDHFNFWINPNADQSYTLEINLQDDDTGDDAAAPDQDDDEFQYNCEVSPTGPCATAGGGWQLVSIPLADFFDDNSFLTAGNGVLDPTPTAKGGNGQLVSVVMAVIGTGGDVNFVTDNWTFTEGPAGSDGGPTAGVIVDDFDSGLPTGVDGDGVPIGFYTFNGAGSTIALSNPTTPPAPARPGADPSAVLQLDIDSTSFAGVIHGFENGAVDTWTPQDWSTSEGFAFWFHGNGSGTAVFIDLLDNRNGGSTVDDAERFTVEFVDDSAGWRYLEFPFSAFGRKEIGNGAPADGLTLFEMHGWAFGTLGTGGPQTFYIDDVQLYGEAEPPAVAIGFSSTVVRIPEGTVGEVGVRLNRALGPDDPEQVTIDYRTEPAAAIPGVEYTPAAGTLTFTRGGPTELSFPVEIFDDDKFEGLERIITRLTNPVGADGGGQGSILIEDDDPYDPDLIDDFENGAFLWEGSNLIEINTVGLAGSGNPRPEQDIVETAMELRVDQIDLRMEKEAVKADLEALLPAQRASDSERIRTAIKRIDESIDDRLWLSGSRLDPGLGARVFTRERQAVVQLRAVANADVPEAEAARAAMDALAATDAKLAGILLELAEGNDGRPARIAKARRDMDRAAADIAAGRPDLAITHYKDAWTQANLALAPQRRTDMNLDLGQAVRDFALGQDWTGTESLDFWFDGTGSGEDITVILKDNRAADPGPAGWDLVWSDEFDAAAGSPPDPANWTHEIGDVTPDGKNGWGNDELQYYTDDPDNAAHDGEGNLVLTLREADGSLECYYGTCEYTSARLLSWRKAEFAYGKVESRLKVPQGAGVWPAFWSLGTDIDINPWPAAGEIDFMEFVGREPNEIFGTIHGPGYSGGQSFGGIYDFGRPVFEEYHTFTVEWEPNLITWYVDGIQYHQARPADVPGPWVFEKPFFLLLNLAVGGNFGGPVGPDTTFPQSYLVDYVRVYQGPDTAERFEASFVDDVDGWTRVSVPIADFVRSADQPAGAPDDGLGLDEVWGYGFEMGTAGTYLVDGVTTVATPPPTELTVTTTADSGPGSLREALGLIGEGGTIGVDPALAGETIALTSGQLMVPRDVTVDGSAAPGLAVSGNDASRVFEIGAGASVTITDLIIRDGAAAPQGGGILNRGSLTLERVTVTDNTENSAAPANFEFGGGGIYNGDGASLALIDSTVSDNTALNQPGGGVYGFFNSSITVSGSTISGNFSGDVAGGFRTLGDVDVVNSTISGNTSTVWHGGGIFHTDGVLTVTNSTVTGNNAPDGTASGILVASFGAPASMTVTNSILEGNGAALACAIEGGAAATIVSGGGNIDTDGSCPLTEAGDQAFTDALLGPLADNGGPTLTHRPDAGGPAVDAALAGACPAQDQRGVARPVGGGCDVGSVEVS